MLAALLPLLGDVLRRVLPDPAVAAQAESELARALLDRQAEIERAAGEIVQTEAASRHWLAANWRPLVMVTFTALIVARWLGWSAPGLTEPEILKLWSIVELGLGGYVIGRTAEKIVPNLVGALRRGP